VTAAVAAQRALDAHGWPEDADELLRQLASGAATAR
jgi:hypothetical protein